jgi:hypothetical protein
MMSLMVAVVRNSATVFVAAGVAAGAVAFGEHAAAIVAATPAAQNQ